MSKNNKPNFPIAHTDSEFSALEQPHHEYDRAKAHKRYSAGLALLAFSAIGVDYLADQEIDPISYVAAPIVGVAGSSALRERGKQQKALKAAKSVFDVTPSDARYIRYK